ncbi:MAG: glycosyl hydrolase [Planctomycetota bacterium]|nr:glycosyl hydrolase [Planctomycetota bacterium]
MTTRLLVCLASCVLVLSSGAHADERSAPEGPASPAAHEAAWARHQALERDSVFQGLPWRSVGPVTQGGRVVDIEVVPGKPFAFYVAYASGGLWYTENNGHSFEPLFDDQPTIIMGDVAIDPSNPQCIWVGTGENNASRSSYGGHGVFRSDDGGTTWRSMGLLESDRIGRVQIDPRDGRRVFVAASGKLYTPGGERGVYRTEDGGKTWQQVLPGGPWTGAIDVQLDPKDPDVVYAALWERKRRPWNFEEAGKGSGLYKSVDGGTTWKRLTDGFPTDEGVGRIGISICHAQPNVVYATVDHQGLLPESQWDLGDRLSAKRVRKMTEAEFLSHSLDEIQGFINELGYEVDFGAKELVEKLKADELSLEALLDKMSDANASLFRTDIRGLEVYRSDDAGATWRRTHAEPLRRVVYTYGYYFGLVRVAPDDPDRVYVAGVPLLTSGDGGKTWASIHGRSVHVDYHAMWIDPASPKHMIVGNDGGIDITYDGGTTWRKVDAQAVGQFYTVAVDQQKPYWIYGGMQDNGTYKGSSRSKPGRNEWERIGGGDGMYVQVDPRDRTVYFGYQFGFYSRRDPSGKTHGVRPKYGLDDEPLRYNWSTPVHLSPHNADVVYFGTNRLFRSMDKGKTWAAISPDLTRSPNRGNVPFACITTISESTHAFGDLLIGTDDGLVHRSRDGGATWTPCTEGLVRDRWCTRVRISRHDAERAYATFSGYRDDDITAYVFTSDDGGATWRSIADGLPAEPVNVILEDPVHKDLLYVGTDRGAYVSFDRGGRWEALPGGLPTVPVHDLVIQERAKELVAGTHGRSVYVLPLARLYDLAKTPSLRDEALHLFPQKTLTASRNWLRVPGTWSNPRTTKPSRKLGCWSLEAGAVTLEVRDADDRLLRTVEAELPKGLGTIEWDLKLDRDAAVRAEAERNAAAETPPAAEGHREAWPQAEAKRMGWPPYVAPGTYTLVLVRGDTRASTTLEVKAPKSRAGRKKPDDGRPPSDR